MSLESIFKSIIVLSRQFQNVFLKVSTGMSDGLLADIPSRYVTSQLGQLSLAALRGRLIEYQLRLWYVRECHFCRVAGNTV